jgi:hypothetical protein
MPTVLPTSTRSSFWTGVTRDRSSEDSRYPDLGGVGGVSLLRDHMLVARPAASTCTRAMSGLWPCIVLSRHGWLLSTVYNKSMLERLLRKMTAPSSKSKSMGGASARHARAAARAPLRPASAQTTCHYALISERIKRCMLLARAKTSLLCSVVFWSSPIK